MMPASIDPELLERAVAKLPADALMPLRREALSRFLETGFPSTKHEDWRYTNLAPAIEVSNAWLRETGGVPEDKASEAARARAAELAAQVDAHWIVLADGIVQSDWLSRLRDAAVPGVTVVSTGAGGVPTPLAPALADAPMTRFNTALVRDALHIRIAAGQKLDKPLGLLFVDDAGRRAAVSQSRVIVEVAAGANAQLVELHASFGGNRHFANVVTELRLGATAVVDFARVQNRDPAHFQVGTFLARIGRDASLRHAAYDLGGALIRNDVAVDIAEAGANVELTGLYLARGTQHIDNHTKVDHRVGPARSDEEYRGILGDRARCVFNGKALVHRGADGTDAHQANHNLLLSEKAEIDTKPELEIYADDVKCSHGATVGQLDRTALFYLRSRGLDQAEATRVLTHAFAAAITARLPVAACRDYVENLVDLRLRDLAGDLTV